MVQSDIVSADRCIFRDRIVAGKIKNNRKLDFLESTSQNLTRAGGPKWVYVTIFWEFIRESDLLIAFGGHPILTLLI